MSETRERCRDDEREARVELIGEPDERGGMVLVVGTIITAMMLGAFLIGVFVGRAMHCG